MNVLLLSTYELGHQPLGLASPLAHLRAAGVAARGLDLAVEPLDEESVVSAAFIGISTPMHTALRLGIEAAERVRALNPRAHICFYGLYASLNSDYLLRTCADSVRGGEIEEPLVELVLSLAAGDSAPPGAYGDSHLAWSRGRAQAPPLRSQRSITSFGRQALLPPLRDGLPPLEQYAHLSLGGERRLAAAVEASRGCAHRCRHCPIPPVYGGRLRIVPTEVVLADVRRLVALGAEHLTFADPDFFNGVRHSMAIVRAIHAESPRLTFDATIKVEHLIEHRALLAELRELGCLFVVSAVESLSDLVLANLDKGHTAADVRTALGLARSAGIALRPSLLPFTPWSTLEDYLELLEFVEANDLIAAVDPIQYAIRLLVPPGSSLLQTEAMQPFLGPLDEREFAYAWRHPDPRMDALAADVAAIVERRSRRSDGPALIQAAVREAACQAAGMAPRAMPALPLRAPAAPVPGLTESWFC